MTKTEKLIKWKEECDEAKLHEARLEGKRDNLYKQLNSDHSCSDSKQAQRKLNKMGKDLDTKEADLDQAISVLETEGHWGQT